MNSTSFELLGFGPGGWGLVLLKGALVTLEISLGAFGLGLLIGLLVALIKLKGPASLVALARLYTTLGRAVPELLLILLLYYGGSMLLNDLSTRFGWVPIDLNGLIAAVIVLGIVQGAYAGEILRGAVLAIPNGQLEAARAFGMRGMLLFRRIVLPLMVPYALAGIANLWLVLLKDSALISVVGYGELLYAGKQAAGTTKYYLTFYLAVAAIYYLMSLLSSAILRGIERRFGRWMPPAHAR